MKRTLFAAALCAALIALSGSQQARAKGDAVAITPDAGPAGTAVQLSSDFWQPDAQVQIFVGSSSSYAEPSSYAGPVATVTSGADGRWSVALTVEDVAGFTVPRVSSFVVYKAVSVGVAGSTGPSEALGYFALTVDGRRPDGAGGILLTIVGEPATAWLDWEPAGSDTFYISHVGPFGPPLRDYSIGRLTNGDWDIVVPALGDAPIAATGGRLIIVRATLCASASIPCDPRPGPLTVVRVAVRDGEASAATITLGAPPRATIMPASGVESVDSRHSGAAKTSGMLFAAGGAVAAIGAALRRRGRLPRRA